MRNEVAREENEQKMRRKSNAAQQMRDTKLNEAIQGRKQLSFEGHWMKE